MDSETMGSESRSWHNNSCRRLDQAFDGYFETCKSCGSFRYCILPPIKQRTGIRLIRLIPDSFETSIRCEVKVCDLDEAPVYEYYAISYTWADEVGNRDRIKEISVSGKTIKVTRNCEMILRRIRHSYDRPHMWIDAICIDQDNDDERGHQVSLMSRIYSRATRLLIYVGEAKDDSDWLLDTLPTLSPENQLPETFNNEQRIERFWQSLGHFLERDYFHRIWVLQEIALSRHKKTLICGGKSLPWDTLVKCSKSSNLSTSPAALHFNHESYTLPNQFLRLLDLARGSKATDPRDKVFALLGLLAMDGSHNNIKADYSHDEVHVYREIALHLGSIYGWDAMLYRAGKQYQSIPGLPSWVPDWSVQGRKELIAKSDRTQLQSILSWEYSQESRSLKLAIIHLNSFSKNQQTILYCTRSSSLEPSLIPNWTACFQSSEPLFSMLMAKKVNGNEQVLSLFEYTLISNTKTPTSTILNRSSLSYSLSSYEQVTSKGFRTVPLLSLAEHFSKLLGGKVSFSLPQLLLIRGIVSENLLSRMFSNDYGPNSRYVPYLMKGVNKGTFEKLDEEDISILFPDIYTLKQCGDRVYGRDLLKHLSFFSDLLLRLTSPSKEVITAKFLQQLTAASEPFLRDNERDEIGRHFKSCGLGCDPDKWLQLIQNRLKEFPPAEESAESLWKRRYGSKMVLDESPVPWWKSCMGYKLHKLLKENVLGIPDRSYGTVMKEIYDASWRLMVRMCLVREVTITLT
ncbi:heterokaryon incompatibility protein-domain-containing protein [Camillea tinctor]|nr:heterokaryon incompatibility protein-domain-containing protein [Camillea tinctor]